MVKPEELLAHAEQLLKTAKGELDYRNSVTNAYYAAYHASAVFEEGLSPRSAAAPINTGSHDSLIQRLERPHRDLPYALQLASKDIGAQLRMLKPLREHASYDLGMTVYVHHAEEAVGAAREVLMEVRKARK